MKSLVALGVLAAALITSAQAERPMALGAGLVHDGTPITRTWSADGRVELRWAASNPARGVVTGDLMFFGRAAPEPHGDGFRLLGTSFVTRTGCAPAPYTVTGRIGGENVVLQGVPPYLESHGCATIRVRHGTELVTTLRLAEH